MLGWFLFGILGVALLVVLGKLYVQASPAALLRALRWGGVAALTALAAALVATGRFGFGLMAALLAWMLAGGRAPALARMGFGGIGGAGPYGWMGGPAGWGGAPSAGQTSSMETDYIAVTLDHDTGDTEGRVKRGTFAGSALEDLDYDDLLALRAELAAADPQGCTLIEALLDREFGLDWREEAGVSGDGQTAHEEGAAHTAAPMSAHEAFEMLGLPMDADEEAVRTAHRRLMMRVHPDRGGSDALAARINAAKDIAVDYLRRRAAL